MMRFYTALAWFLICVFLISWIAALARQHVVTAILFGWLGYSFRSDIDTGVRVLQERVEQWLVDRGMS